MKNNQEEKSVFETEWQGMPEFNQPEAGPYKQVLVGFANKEDMHKFSKMIGQRITMKTRSVWFPIVPNDGASDKVYVDTE